MSVSFVCQPRLLRVCRAMVSKGIHHFVPACLPAQDVGCCFGQELRKAILDGYPEANVVASDLTSEYW